MSPDAPTPTDQWLTIEEVCRFLRVSRRTVYNWIAQGKLRPKRTPGGSCRIDRNTLLTDTARPTP